MEPVKVGDPRSAPSVAVDVETLALYDALERVPVVPASHGPIPNESERAVLPAVVQTEHEVRAGHVLA
jgi:hypothetical protein